MIVRATDELSSSMAAPDHAAARMRVAVVIATKGRPSATAWVMRLLARQTVRPHQIILSASSEDDIGSYDASGLRVHELIGTTGSSVQRNCALDALAPNIDVVIFLDDDFALERHWIERCVQRFASDAALVGLSGLTLRDGANTEPIAWEEAVALVDGAHAEVSRRAPLRPCVELYGCNMACRAHAISDLRFDERLVLYGWMEDKDFSRRLARRGRLAYCDDLLGVHLGLRGGRVSGRRFGYSQVVNAMYLCKKGVMSRKEAASNILRALGMNCVKSVSPEAHLDRRGRLIGNVIGIIDLCLGAIRPERATRL